jgi:hypothetical protein
MCVCVMCVRVYGVHVLNVYTYVCMHVGVCVCGYVCMYVCMMYAFVYVCMYA